MPSPSERSSSAVDPFKELLARVRPEVDRRLKRIWSQALRSQARRGKTVTSVLRAAADLALRGGKRFRAAMLLSAYRGVAPRAALEPALAAAAAIELFQAYLLIQDDWMDGDVERRGGPSVHAELGGVLGDDRLAATSAILASDFTWGLAVQTLAGAQAPSARVLDTLQTLCQIHADVVIGQQIDALGDAASPRDVELMHALKTGSYTVKGPLALGAALGGASAEVRGALARYAEPLGVAFQLRDDLFGAFGTSEQTGKREGGDLIAGKRSAVLVAAERALTPRGKAALARVVGRPASPRHLAEARSALEACGARRAVERRLFRLCDRASELAAALPISRPSRAELIGAAEALRDVPGRAS